MRLLFPFLGLTVLLFAGKAWSASLDEWAITAYKEYCLVDAGNVEAMSVRIAPLISSGKATIHRPVETIDAGWLINGDGNAMLAVTKQGNLCAVYTTQGDWGAIKTKFAELVNSYISQWGEGAESRLLKQTETSEQYAIQAPQQPLPSILHAEKLVDSNGAKFMLSASNLGDYKK